VREWRKYARGNVLEVDESEGYYGGGNYIGERKPYVLTVTCEKDMSEEIEATIDGVVWITGLGKGG